MSTLGRLFLVVLALGLPADAVAQAVDAAADTTIGEPPPVDGVPVAGAPQRPDLWAVELTGGFFLEAWDLNRFQEQLLGGGVGVIRQVAPNWTVGLETTLLHVNQTPAGNVFLPALSMMVRWSPLRWGRASVFFEGGGGASYASDEVPNLGTRFNLVSQTGVGVSHPVNTRVEFIGALRWLHVSNNSLDGRLRNPDIQALGLYVGWRLH
jgi:hypothetical protein